jgi:hypothetical protein
MAQLTRNSYFKNLLANEVFEGEPHKVEADYNTLKVTIETDEVGVLSVFQSIDSKTYNSYGDVFNITGLTHKQIHIKGRYVYVKYENGASNTSNFTLYSVLSKSVGSGVGLQEVLVTNDYLDVSGAVSVNGLLFDASGALKVSGISGGGVSSDVNVTNALLAVKDLSNIDQQRIQTDRILFDTDIIANRLHDISGSVHITNAELSVRDASAVALLENIYQATGNTEINTTPIAYSPVHLDLETQGATVWADSTVDWFAPTNGENGWQYNNTTQGGSNAYWFSNTSLVAGGVEPDITLGSLMNMSFVANYRLLLDSNPNKKFYIALTTKPTGSSDYYPGVFKSRKVYELPSSTVISKGADSLFWAINDVSSFRRDLDHKEMALAISNGTCGSDEVIQFMSINVDSGTTVNQFSGILKECYFSTAGGTNRQVVFDNSISRKADLALSKLSVEMGTLQVNMGGFTFNGDDELQVTMPTNTNIKCNDAFLTHTVADTKNCLDVQVNNITACDTGAVVIASGSLDVSGVSVIDSKLSVLDVSANLELLTIREILADQVNVANYGLLDDTPTYAPIRVDASGAMLVHVNNPSSGGGVVDLSGASFVDGKLNVYDLSANAVLDLLTFVDVDANTGNLKVIDLANNEILSNLSFFTNEDTVTDLRVRVQNVLEVRNPESESLSVSVPSAVSVQNTTGGGSLDVHCFGSSDGTTFHHLKTTANGQLVVHAETRDGTGTAITSTPNGGITALDVAISGTATVSGIVDARAQVAFAPQVLTNTNVTGPVQIGTTTDIDHFLYVSAIMSFSSVTTGGNIYLEVSPDANLWARPSGAQVFINTSITNVTASILVSSAVAMRYVRLYADSPFAGVSGNAFISAK